MRLVLRSGQVNPPSTPFIHSVRVTAAVVRSSPTGHAVVSFMARSSSIAHLVFPGGSVLAIGYIESIASPISVLTRAQCNTSLTPPTPRSFPQAIIHHRLDSTQPRTTHGHPSTTHHHLPHPLLQYGTKPRQNRSTEQPADKDTHCHTQTHAVWCGGAAPAVPPARSM